MADGEHLKILEQGVEAWHRWREEKPEVCPNLRAVDLRWAYLREAVLMRATFRGANLRERRPCSTC